MLATLRAVCLIGHLIAVRCLLEFWASQNRQALFLLGQLLDLLLGRVPQMTKTGTDRVHLPCNSKPVKTSHNLILYQN